MKKTLNGTAIEIRRLNRVKEVCTTMRAGYDPKRDLKTRPRDGDRLVLSVDDLKGRISDTN